MTAVDRDLRALAAALIERALADLQDSPPLVGKAQGELVEQKVREEALLFCFSEGAGWKSSREFWAGLAGQQGSAITAAARKVLTAPPPPAPPAPVPSVDELLALGNPLKVEDVRARFNLNPKQVSSCTYRLRKAGYTVTFMGRKSGAYQVSRQTAA
jgi:hypothetical protein